MGIETERKFLVTGDFLSHFVSATRLTQGYLCRDPERTVRVRVDDGEKKAWITIKGLTSTDGMTRSEWEYEIPVKEGHALLKLPGVQSLSKVRYLVPVEDGYYKYEVDVFLGMNQGLVVAEIEFLRGDPHVVVPDWVGEEVTGDPRYYNSSLIDNPYTKW